jgi:hypothetical protein
MTDRINTLMPIYFPVHPENKRTLKILGQLKLVLNEPLGVCIVNKDPSPGMILQSYFDRMDIQKDITCERSHQVVGKVIRIHINNQDELVVDCYVNCEYKEMLLSRVHNQSDDGNKFYVGVIW